MKKQRQTFTYVLEEDFDLEARRLKYGYYNNRSEVTKKTGSERK
jgi:hypothetical protein